ncbi:hypothetical protein CY35_03G121900 [Sphagnum magellanicum]|nr:hypothetical protein CY35_03G121900 [Sphagnum magellanicum]KAH9569235.1 hypothetical protein CY35_03G121900 [Sphagnum magellanicum]
MGAGISFMSANVATPPTSEWQALASSFASDSATLMSRLLLLFIFITIAACGLHLHMRKRLSGSDDGPTGEEPPEDIEMNDLHSAEGPSSFTDAVAASILSAANTVSLDAVSIAMNASS